MNEHDNVKQFPIPKSYYSRPAWHRISREYKFEIVRNVNPMLGVTIYGNRYRPEFYVRADFWKYSFHLTIVSKR